MSECPSWCTHEDQVLHDAGTHHSIFQQTEDGTRIAIESGLDDLCPRLAVHIDKPRMPAAYGLDVSAALTTAAFQLGEILIALGIKTIDGLPAGPLFN